MKKCCIILIITLLLIPIVTASFDICEDTREIKQNCSMVSPNILCTDYNYNIINTSNGLNVESNNLSLLYSNGSIYYFNFTQPKGDYLIILCDNTTRQVRVMQEEDNNMILAAIILLPLLLGFAFIISGNKMDEQHNVLKFFLFLLAIPMFFLSFYLGIVNVIEFYDFPAIQNAMSFVMLVVGGILFIIVSYIIIYLIYRLFMNFKKNKEKQLEY